MPSNRFVPESGRTLAEFAAPGRTDGLSISRPLAFAVPVLFAWVFARAGR